MTVQEMYERLTDFVKELQTENQTELILLRTLKIIQKELNGNDDSIDHEHESAGYRADGHTESQASDNADQIGSQQETRQDRSDGERG